MRREDFSELPGFGLRNPLQRAPAMRDIAPEGTQFVEGHFSNAAGRRAYKLFMPSHTQGRRLPLIVMLLILGVLLIFGSSPILAPLMYPFM